MVRDHLKTRGSKTLLSGEFKSNQIAKQMEISRSYVSKLLIEARKEKTS